MPISKGFRLLRIVLVLIVGLVGFSAESRSQLSSDEVERTNNAIREATELQKQGKYEQSIALFKGTLARVKKLMRPGDARMVGLTAHLANAYFVADQFDKAEPIFREAVKLGRSLPKEAGEARFSSLQGLAATLTKLEKFDEAVSLCEEALKEREGFHGPDASQTNTARSNLVYAYFSAKRFADAIPNCLACLKYAEDRFKADGPETIRFRNNLAIAFMETSKYTEAKELFEQSMIIATKRLKPDDEERMQTSIGLTKASLLLNKSADVVELAVKDLKAVEARSDVSPTDLITALANLAAACQTKGRYAEAETHYLRALDLSRTKLGPSQPLSASILSNYSTMLTSQARFGEAERRIREALEITAKNPGRGTDAFARQKVNLATIYVKTNRPAEARLLVDEALGILEALPNKKNPDIAAVRHNLATLYYLAKDYKNSVKLGKIALDELREQFGGDNHSTAIVMVNLGHSYLYLGDFENAEAWLKRAVAIMEAERGMSTGDLSSARNALADLYSEMKRFDQAEEISRKNVNDAKAILGLSHPDTAIFIDNLASMLYSQGKQAEAFAELDGARRSRRDFLLRTLPALSEGDQFALVNQNERLSRDFALLIAVKHRAEPGVAAQSAEWVVNGKSITTQATAMSAVLARDAKTPEAIRILGELNATRSRLTQLALARDKDDKRPVAPGEDYQALATKEQDLSRQLGLALGKPVYEDCIELPKVRDTIPDDAVFIEFAKIFVTESMIVKDTTQPKLARYAAWVIPPNGKGEVSLVDLGFAETLEKEISDALRAIQSANRQIINPGDEAAAEKKALESLQVLSDRIYKPLEASLKPAKRWVLGLDGALWLVPWASLPVAEGRYAVEDHLIHLAISGRDQLTGPSKDESGASAIFADPDYQLGPGKAAAVARESGKIKVASRGSASTKVALPEAFEKGFNPLPGTRAEANAIAPLLETITKSNSNVFLGAEASETVFKALQGPKVLVLSTHGFFLGEPDSISGADPASPSAANPLANPLQRCGLILAGADNRSLSSKSGETDDGILTGLEIVGADLRGTDLVVLSACETALGDIRGGEGVAGLRQVFQIAGADSVVATLWQIPDDESYQLMSCFFQGMARGRGSATALREAQLAMIADRRKKLKAAHPYYWAAYTMTGFPGKAWRDEALTPINSPDLPIVPPPPEKGAISPVTGRRLSSSRWPDGVMALVLAVGGGFLVRWWWQLGTGVRF